MATATRQCRHCKQRKRREDMKITPNNAAFCGDDCRVAYALKQAPKIQAKQRAQDKRERLANDFSHQLELTRVKFNTMIRALDKGEPCRSCGKHICGSEFHAGHFKSVGSFPELRFDPRNVHIQGAGCNIGEKYASKKRRQVKEGYEERLRELYGDDLVDWLNGPHGATNYTCEDLKDIRAVCIAETKHLESFGEPTMDWRSLDYNFIETVRAKIKELEKEAA